MDNVFIDSEGKIKRSSMHDEHSIVSIVEKNPNASNIGNIVSGDTNSNIITFEMARYYDGEDIYNKNIRFIIKNNLGVYTEEAVNLQYNDTKIRFSWILTYSDTHNGNVTVAIEFYGENESKLPYSLKTTPFSFSPKNSLDATDMIVDKPENWFVTIENRLTALESNTSVDNLAQKVADSIPYEDEEIDFSTEFETGGNL